MTKHLNITLTDAEADHLHRAAEREDVPVDDIVSRLVQQQMDYDAWLQRKVQKAIDELKRGEGIAHEDVVAHMDKLRAELLAKKAAAE